MREEPSKITFQVSAGEDGVPVGKLIAKMKGILRALIELDIQMSEDQRKTTRWVIAAVSYNSPLTMTIAQRPIRGRTANRDVPKAFIQGVKLLEKSSTEPPHFTPRIMQATRQIVNDSGKKGADLTISGPGGMTVKPTRNLIKHVDTALQNSHYREYTTIEGKLDTINIHRGLEFVVYDPLTDQPTVCRFDEKLEIARNALGHRVSVTGWATYNRQDQPISLEVDELQVFGDPSELPRFLEGEEIDITGGIDSVEYIRRARDVE